MKLKQYLLSAFPIGLVSLIGFCSVAFLVSDHKVVQFDWMLISVIQGHESPTLTVIMKFFTFIGSFPAILTLFVIISLLLFFVLKRWAEVLLLATVIIGTQIINIGLKAFFHRARPEFHRLIDIGGYSFPSGHAMSAFTLYGILTFILWRHMPSRFGRTMIIIISSIFIIMIGISRIYLGVHYPSDIIGGYFASGVWLTIAIWYFRKYVLVSLE